MKFEQEFREAKPKYEYLLNEFRDALEVDEVTWEMLTLRNLTKIKDFLLEECSANSVATYCAVFKAFLAQFSDTDLLPCGAEYKNALRVKKTASEQITLNETEMALIELYEPKSKCEREVKAQFMCEYYSLARYSDIQNFTSENINEEEGVITYVSKKTKKTAIVPLHRNFLRYFNERGDSHNTWVYNTTMKRIARRCGIDTPVKIFYRGKEQVKDKCDLVGSHTARRSAATNLAKRGVPIPTIAKMMSHGQDFAMTQRYIWIDEVQLDENGRAFFY